jgi:polysaccharide export outer membrane protein
MALVVSVTAAAQQSVAIDKAVTAGYVLGPDDQIVLHSAETPEISDKPVLIGKNGNITLPLIGRVQAGGLTVEQLESTLDGMLAKYVKEPNIAVTVTDFRSQPVSVFGAVKSPGVYQLRGQKTLYEVLALAGGPTDSAGSTLTITRPLANGVVPVPDARTDASQRFSVAELNVEQLLNGKSPTANIQIMPRDTITLSQANSNMIYVVGDVEHGGAFTLGSTRQSTVLRALSLSGGLGRTAKPEHARIIRASSDGLTPLRIPVNLKLIVEGRKDDIALLPDDVLVVPTSGRKVFTTYALPAAVSAAAYGAIYHF